MAAGKGAARTLSTIFASLSADIGIGFLVQPKSAAVHRECMDSLPGRTSMKVTEARAINPIASNQIHVLPPESAVPPPPGQSTDAPGVDHVHDSRTLDRFFTALARRFANRAVGITLSGIARDGASGLQAIKSKGGLTIAEARASAQCFELPASVIQCGCVDAVLPAEDIPVELQRIAAQRQVHARRNQFKPRTLDPLPPGKDLPGKVLFLLGQRSGIDFSLYRQDTLRRRMRQRMALQRLHDPEAYLALLRLCPDELDSLCSDLIINPRGFFRDLDFITLLEEKILPGWLRNRRTRGGACVWMPFCGTGEDAYSLAMVLLEAIEQFGGKSRPRIDAMDMGNAALEVACSGRYPSSLMPRTFAGQFGRFFHESRGVLRFKQNLREVCHFTSASPFQPPASASFDVLDCRNVPLYLVAELQNEFLPRWLPMIRRGGIVMMGPRETMAINMAPLKLIDARHRIFLVP